MCVFGIVCVYLRCVVFIVCSVVCFTLWEYLRCVVLIVCSIVLLNSFH